VCALFFFSQDVRKYIHGGTQEFFFFNKERIQEKKSAIVAMLRGE